MKGSSRHAETSRLWRIYYFSNSSYQKNTRQVHAIPWLIPGEEETEMRREAWRFELITGTADEFTKNIFLHKKSISAFHLPETFRKNARIGGYSRLPIHDSR